MYEEYRNKSLKQQDKNCYNSLLLTVNLNKMTIVHPLVEGRTTKLTLKKNIRPEKTNKLKRINIKQEDVASIIFNEDRLCHSPPLSKTLNALSIYQLNIYQNFSFVPRLKSNNIPKIFTELIKKPKHKYPTVSKTQVSKFSKSSYI